MHKVRIKVLRISEYKDLSEIYEEKLELPCNFKEGEEFIYEGKYIKGFCKEAYKTLLPFLKDLRKGKGHFYGKRMKNPYSALISCNDGFRPVSFYLERIENKD